MKLDCIFIFLYTIMRLLQQYNRRIILVRVSIFVISFAAATTVTPQKPHKNSNQMVGLLACQKSNDNPKK